ncbi:MAG TPA: serine/threonine-protein kinase [Polyangiaceae bacterium]
MTAEPRDPPKPEARVGQVLNGKWQIDRLLDTGGMGAVYVATHRNGRRAAIKILHARFARDPEVRKRFLREGYVANKMGHPGAVAILDDDIAEDGSPYLVMELLDGESLSAWLHRIGGRIPISEVLAIAGQVLEVLQIAHAAGIVHRDIKPANIFVTKGGYAKLLDFGLARVRDGSISLIPTAQGIVMGTAGYMSPEQARGKTDLVDARADIFSLGAVMFRALTGRRIHEKSTAFDTTMAGMTERAPSLASVMPEARPRLVAAVDRALTFEREGRWQTARDMFEALREAYAEDKRARSSSTVQAVPSPSSVEVPITIEEEQSSLVVDVAFGAQHDAAMERERQRTREVIEGLSSLSIVVAEEEPSPDEAKRSREPG